ncbi:MAG: DUF4340 domain-containing protein [Nitrospinota bacterium]|nr:DUF4340 domain-containing protein [Nitrospinota bacterium]
MKFRNTFLLILVFIALGLYLVFVEVPADKKKDEEETLSKKVIAFKVEDVQEFDLIKPSGTIKLKRNPADSRWNISEPMAVSGEDGVINQLLLQLEEARITRVVDEDPKNLADFGLQEPQLKIALRFKTGEPKTLLIGEASPIGHNIYLKLMDDKRVLLSFLDTNQFEQPLNDLRNKALLDFVALDVTAVDLQYEKETQHLVKEGGVWKLTAPVKALGDADEISNFLNSILSERIETFVAETMEDIDPIGLASPKIVLNIKAEKAKQSWTLKIGKQYDDHSYYAQRGEPENVITVSDSLVETLSRNPLNFMEKSLISFKEDEVTRIENRDGNDIVQVVRDPGKTGLWKFEASDTEMVEGMGAVDSATVNTLLLDLQEARIQEFSPINNLKLFGLDNPQRTLIVFTKDGKQESLSLGNPAKDNRHFFVTRSRDQTIFKLDADTVKKIFRSRKDFKDKKLLKFKAEQVARIRMEYPDKTFELEKRDNQWVLVQPEKLDDLKPFVGKDILWTLNNLEYETKLNPEEAEEATGLGQPRLILTLQDQDNKSIGSLKIGQPVKDRPLLYSQLIGDPTLYHIKDRTLSEIPDRMDRFRKNDD